MATDNGTALTPRQERLLTAQPAIMQGMALAPVEQQAVLLKEYDERRSYFLRWLTAHLQDEVHFGFPPGTRRPDAKGYRAKPSLYKSGALLICDLLRLRPQFVPDAEFWRMAGATNGSFAVRCDLVSADTGEVQGSGRGLFEAGEKRMPANSAMKMACKRALVDAVITACPVASELFTQDVEDAGDKPEARVVETEVVMASADQLQRLEDLARHAHAPEAVQRNLRALLDGGKPIASDVADRWALRATELIAAAAAKVAREAVE